MDADWRLAELLSSPRVQGLGRAVGPERQDDGRAGYLPGPRPGLVSGPIRVQSFDELDLVLKDRTGEALELRR